MHRRLFLIFLLIANVVLTAIPRTSVRASTSIQAWWVRPNNDMNVYARPGTTLTLTFHAEDPQGLRNATDGISAWLEPNTAHDYTTMTRDGAINPAGATSYDGTFTIPIPSNPSTMEWVVFLVALGTNHPYCSGNYQSGGHPSTTYMNYWNIPESPGWGSQKDCGPYDVILLHLDSTAPTIPTVTCQANEPVNADGYTKASVTGTASGSTDNKAFDKYVYEPTNRTRTTYGTIRAKAVDKAGNESGWGSCLAKIDSVAPPAPGGVRDGAHPEVQSNVLTWHQDPVFTWDPVQDGNGTNPASGLEKYEVYWGTDGSATTPTDQVTTPSFPVSLPSTVTSPTNYYLKVRSVDKVGNTSAWTTFVYQYQYDTVQPQVTAFPTEGLGTNLWGEVTPGVRAKLTYGPASTGQFQVAVTTGTGGVFADPVQQIVYPDVFAPGDGGTVDANNATVPATYLHTYSLPTTPGAGGTFTVQVIKASGRVLTTTFEVGYDDSAPQISAFNLDTASLPLSHLEGSKLFYGTQTSGIIVASFQASDTPGVREVSFPTLFQTGAETQPGGDSSTVYSKTYTVNGASDTTAGTFAFTAVDRVGNVSTQVVAVVKDTTPPVVVMTTPTAVPFEFTATWQPTETESGVASYTVRGYDASTGQWLTLSLLGEQTQLDLTGGVDANGVNKGITQLKVTTVDHVGNVSLEANWTVSKWQAVTKYYAFGGQPVAVRHAEETDTGQPLDAGTVAYLVTDHLSSTSLVLDPNGVEVVSQTRYDPFGEVRWSKGVEPTEKGYTGQRSEGFGLLDYNARLYDPHLGRFISPDTLIQYPSSALAYDRYSYAYNNPIKYIDPTGHTIEPPTFVFCENGCPIIDMSGWSEFAQDAVGAILALTVDTVTNGATGVYEDGTWGVNPYYDYLESGAWTLPPVFGGIASGADDLTKAGKNVLDDLINGAIRKSAKEILEGLGVKMPLDKVRTADGMGAWLRQLEMMMKNNPDFALTREQADALVEYSRKFGVEPEFKIDLGHVGTEWESPHLHFGKARIHISVPKDYQVPK